MDSTSFKAGSRCAVLRTAAAALLALGAFNAQAATVTLCAEPHVQDYPGAAGVAMWGYRQVVDAAACAANPGVGTTSPGPLLTLQAGDATLAVTLVNRLTVPTSLVLAAQALASDGGAAVMAADVVGPSCVPSAAAAPSAAAHPLNCRVRSFTGETAPGSSRTYTFTNLRAGSYLYQSGTHPQVQVQMGLSGLARIYPSGDAGFDRDLPVVLSEIDVAMHERIAATLGSADLAVQQTWKSGANSTLNYAPRLFLINGKAFGGIDANGNAATDLALSAANGSRIGLRIANAGLQSRSLVLNNGTWKLLNEDGHAYAAPREQASVLVPAGKTIDARLIAVAPADGSTNRSTVLFDRRGGTDNADGTMLGGQVARLAVSGPANPSIAPVAAQVANEGTAFALQLTSANVTSFVLTNPPAGMVVSSTGLIGWPVVPTGTPAPTAYDVTVTGNGSLGTASQTFNVRINHAPQMLAPAALAVAHGSVTRAAPGLMAGATDPDSDTPLVMVQTAGPTGGTLTTNANGSFTWSGPQPATGTTAVTFTVAARDAFNLASTPVTVTLNVAANVAPVAAGAGTFSTPAQTVTLVRNNNGNPVNLINQLMTNPSPLRISPYANWVSASDADGSVAPTTFSAVVTKVSTTSGAALALGNCSPGVPLTEAMAAVVAGDTLTFVPRHCPGQNAARTFPTGGVDTTTSALGVYRITYFIRDDQGAASNSVTLFVRVQ